MSAASPTPQLLTQAEVAQRLGVKPSTLSIWRTTGRYRLPYVKCGRLVRYREDEVNAFIERRTREHTSADAPPSVRKTIAKGRTHHA